MLAQKPNRKPDDLAAELVAALTGKTAPAAAEPLLRECLERASVPLWQGDWLRAELASRHGDCLRRMGEFDRAKPILETAARDVAKAVGVPAWGVAASRKRVADLYTAMNNPAEAAKWK
jgi:hypothetical protein